MTQINRIESFAGQDPAVVTWGEALSELLDVASEKARELIAGNVGVVALRAVPDLPDLAS